MSGTATQAVKTQGTLLYMYDDAGANPVKIAEVTDFSINESKDVIDATQFDSPDGFKEKIASWKDPGSSNMTLQYVPGGTTHQQLIDDYDSDFLRKFKVVLPVAGSPEIIFHAFSSALGQPFPLDGKLTLQITLTLSGAITRPA